MKNKRNIKWCSGTRDHKNNRQPSHRRDEGKETQQTKESIENRTHLFSPLFHTRRWRGQVSFCGSSVHVSYGDGQDTTLHQQSNKWQQQQSHVNLIEMSLNPPRDAVSQCAFKCSAFVSHQNKTFTDKLPCFFFLITATQSCMWHHNCDMPQTQTPRPMFHYESWYLQKGSATRFIITATGLTMLSSCCKREARSVCETASEVCRQIKLLRQIVPRNLQWSDVN